jgi:hypothetical protein
MHFSDKRDFKMHIFYDRFNENPVRDNYQALGMAIAWLPEVCRFPFKRLKRHSPGILLESIYARRSQRRIAH